MTFNHNPVALTWKRLPVRQTFGKQIEADSTNSAKMFWARHERNSLDQKGMIGLHS